MRRDEKREEEKRRGERKEEKRIVKPKQLQGVVVCLCVPVTKIMKLILAPPPCLASHFFFLATCFGKLVFSLASGFGKYQNSLAGCLDRVPRKNSQPLQKKIWSLNPKLNKNHFKI